MTKLVIKGIVQILSFGLSGIVLFLSYTLLVDKHYVFASIGTLACAGLIFSSVQLLWRKAPSAYAKYILFVSAILLLFLVGIGMLASSREMPLHVACLRMLDYSQDNHVDEADRALIEERIGTCFEYDLNGRPVSNDLIGYRMESVANGEWPRFCITEESLYDFDARLEGFRGQCP